MHILTLFHFLAEVVYTQEFWKENLLKFFTAKLQPHSLKVSSKKKSFSVQCSFDYKHLFIKINQKTMIQTI